MPRGTAFADVLDDLLDAAPVQQPAPRRAGVATHSFFPFDRSRFAAAPRTSAPAVGFTPRQDDEPPRAAGGSPLPFTPRAPRRARALTPRQQLALDTLVTLGARITSDFSGDELRAQFRALALRYHPDRHPGSTGPEKARLAALFSQLHDAYEHLKAAPLAA